MEAVCRGAREAGGAPVGVTVEAFQFRGGPNRYVAREIRATDLYERTRRLIDSADAFLVLEGKAGTLAEVSFVWALNRAGLLDGPCPVFLYGAGWEPLYRFLERSGALTEVAGNGAGCTEWITDLELLQERILAYGQERTRA